MSGGADLPTIDEAIARHALVNAGTKAITFLEDGEDQTSSLTFAEIDLRARCIAQALLQKAPGAKRALLVYGPGLDFVTALCGCFYAGVAAIPVPPPSTRANSRSGIRFARLVQDARPDAILVHSEQLARLRWFAGTEAGLPQQQWICTDDPDMSIDEGRVNVGSDDIALIQYTSGSTGAPKGVVVTHKNLSANLAAITGKFSLTRQTRVVSWLPQFHDMGLIGGIIEALWTGYELVLMDPRHFAQRPLRWLRAIDRFHADVSGGANFAYDLCIDALTKDAAQADFDLSHWRLAFTGAEPVRASTLQRFEEVFSRYGFSGKAFYPTYGLAEATLMATGPDPDHQRPEILAVSAIGLAAGKVSSLATDPADTMTLVSCGTPCPETVLDIVNVDTGRVCDEGEIGEIQLAGPGISPGYFPVEPTDEAPSLRTGDLGFVLRGQLYVTGRRKDLIIVRGKNLYPTDIEEVTAASHPSLALNAAVAFGAEVRDSEMLIVACEVKREARRGVDFGAVTQAIYQEVTRVVGVMPHDIVLLRPGALPRTTSGKVQRGAARESWMKDTWKPLWRLLDTPATTANQMQTESLPSNPSPVERLALLEQYLRVRIAELGSTSTAFVSMQTKLHEAGLDSLKIVEFGLDIESWVGCTLPVDLLDDEMSIADLAVAIRATLAKSSDEPAGQSRQNDVEPRSGEPIPLAPLQRRFLSAGVGDPAGFVEIAYLRTPRNLDVNALKLALEQLTVSHDAFSMRFRQDGEAWVQSRSDTTTNISFREVDVAAAERQALAAMRTSMREALKAGINLSAGPLANAIFLNRGKGEHGLLMLAMHHLVVDGVSLSILLSQLQQVYRDVAQGVTPLPGNSSSSFASWLLALASFGKSPRVQQQTEYWRDMCGMRKIPGKVSLEARQEVSEEDSSAAPEWHLCAEQTLSPIHNRVLMRDFISSRDRNALFVAALGWAWRETTGEPDLLMKLENHGRLRLPNADPRRTVGWLVNQYPFCAPVGSECTPGEYLHRVQSGLDAVPDQGVGYGLLVQGDDASQARWQEIRQPVAFLQYRGSLDETYRSAATFPVLSVFDEFAPMLEADQIQEPQMGVRMLAGIRKGTFFWRVATALPFDTALGEALVEQTGEFLASLARGAE